ncbi:hypothetical protein [Acinetobacter beijerinckii]|uniref:Uncharacterized protein n=1 Tax=Acinetobacter beijerinckii ANC 3835 TaxID=1217649 RepID=N9DX32_9GAMM|nr:hypothetical protein [Acinetobacter beijerinckii]ENW02487.1 hypothetical protein F934_03348 [Acinetobacter beijerinckii ANC 3835]
MTQLNKLFSFVVAVLLTLTSSVYADEVQTLAHPPIQLTLKSNQTEFSIDSNNASAVPVPIQNVQGVDPIIALTGVIVGYMVADKISSTSEQAEQKKRIPRLLKLSESINPHILLKNQLSTELIKQPKWSDGRSYQLEIDPEYHLSSALNTIKMIFKYQLKTSKENKKNEITKAQVYIFHNLAQEAVHPEKQITWEDVDESQLKNTFLDSATLLTEVFSNVDVNQVPQTDFVIATTIHDEKIRGYIIKQQQDWLWLLDQNKNIYILKPKRTFVLNVASTK